MKNWVDGYIEKAELCADDAVYWAEKQPAVNVGEPLRTENLTTYKRRSIRSKKQATYYRNLARRTEEKLRQDYSFSIETA